MSAEAGGRIRVLLVEEDCLVRQALRMVLELEADLSVVGEAGDSATAVSLARSLQPDAIVTELPPPDAARPPATAELVQAAPHTTVIVLTHFDGVARRREALALGAAVCVGKHEPYETLLSAIRGAARGATTR